MASNHNGNFQMAGRAPPPPPPPPPQHGPSYYPYYPYGGNPYSSPMPPYMSPHTPPVYLPYASGPMLMTVPAASAVAYPIWGYNMAQLLYPNPMASVQHAAQPSSATQNTAIYPEYASKSYNPARSFSHVLQSSSSSRGGRGMGLRMAGEGRGNINIDSSGSSKRGRGNGSNRGRMNGGQHRSRDGGSSHWPHNGPIPRSDNAIWITIGPQCAGKTTFVRNSPHAVVDVAIDDCPMVYRKMKVDDIMRLSADELKAVYSESFCSMSLYDRFIREEEQGLLLVLFKRQISLEEFESRIRAAGTPSGADKETDCEVFIRAVRDVYSSPGGPMFQSETIDIFIHESLFPDAINSAEGAFVKAISSNTSSVVSWSNMNLVPDNYRVVLELAEQTHRPVVFIRWGFEMPRLELYELFRRSICRYLETGRYIPSGAISRCTKTANSFLTRNDTPEKLANAAGFRFDKDSRVSALPKRDPAMPNSGMFGQG